ncbi:sigma factor-like helix-turn-helix DNA-binding protein [uncultured Dysosmobacter sp.]|uniref:sigma factor-like helix-turn-helix DNA-binding protein n=1 Tax=uncultured Dysosmobacter sp. TaxID=2591384 RepID=UPI002617790F|nr:sigma factor-like helix-turn-helix DNA-binding protein [uncultured Dysosmobacter sp.]
MTAKEYLSQARRLDEIINCRLRELEYWRHLAGSISGTRYDGMPHSPNRPTEAPFARCLDKIDEIERDIDRRIDELVDLRDTINRAIDTMDNADERTLLRCRYLENSSWSEIGGRLHVSNRTVHRIHSSALANFSVPD